MDSDNKSEKKNLIENKAAEEKENSDLLESKRLHDLYRHVTKLIK